ncbi:MAG TPA: substrate-binding domain-containing protein [Phycisphaerae bacterium]|jgi:ribose transport system substrate-binding protein|nr:substrate-binding domain-containing protein [Phycisphaerae bacterium]
MRIGAFLLAAAASLALTSGAFAQAKQKFTFGIVAKSQSNPVFQAAHKGAQDAAKELGAKYNVDITINIQTPPAEDAQKEAQAVEQLANAQVDGIAVSCSNANTLVPAINKAVEMGVPVMCFDSDSPRSKRFAYYGTDDTVCGREVAENLAKFMGGKGNVAILAGNQSAPNLQARAQAVKETLAKYPGIKIIDTVYHEETPDKAALAVQREQTAHPEINGWAMIGGWPLFTQDALKWDPGTVKVVSVDALPPELAYLKSGHVQLLLAQDCYGWGYKSVEILLAKAKDGKDPANPKVIDPLTPVTKENADEFAKKWDKWLGK